MKERFSDNRNLFGNVGLQKTHHYISVQLMFVCYIKTCRVYLKNIVDVGNVSSTLLLIHCHHIISQSKKLYFIVIAEEV